eukprot:4212796-Ditylum_brightwellii.AAC.1
MQGPASPHRHGHHGQDRPAYCKQNGRQGSVLEQLAAKVWSSQHQAAGGSYKVNQRASKYMASMGCIMG